MTQKTAYQDNLKIHSTNAGRDAFVTKLDSRGNLVYSTYLGERLPDEGSAIVVDPDGNSYVAGNTDSPDFPSIGFSYYFGPFERNRAFITKFDPKGAPVYSMHFGGRQGATGTGIAADGQGNAYLVGFTASHNFHLVKPRVGKCQGDPQCGESFISKIRSDRRLYRIEGRILK